MMGTNAVFYRARCESGWSGVNGEKRTRACLSRAIALALVAVAGCSYIAVQPEVNPQQFAPPSAQSEWHPSGKTAAGGAAAQSIEKQNAHAPSVRPNGPYGMAELIDLALRNNPDTRRVWEAARAAAASYGISQAPYYPLVSAQTQAGYSRVLFELPTNSAVLRQWQITPMAELTYTLLDFGRRSASGEVARQQLAAENFTFNRALQSVVFNVQRSFYALAASKAAVEAAQRNFELAKTDDEAVAQRVSLGLATQPALLLSRERVAQSEYDLANVRLMVREATANLAVAIGVAANDALDVESLGKQSVPLTLGGEVDGLIDSAIRRRPDLAAQSATIRTTHASVARAKAEFLPTVGLQAYYGNQTWGYSVDSPFTQKSSQPQYGALLTLRWDIFTGFMRVNTVRQAEAQREEAVAGLKSLEVSATAEVWRAYYEFEASQKKYDYAKALLAASQEAYNANLDTYRQGLVTIVELLTAERDLASARYTIIQSTADLLTSSAAVAYAVGAIETPPRP
jgi:outer membrane protein TolC